MLLKTASKKTNLSQNWVCRIIHVSSQVPCWPSQTALPARPKKSQTGTSAIHPDLRRILIGSYSKRHVLTLLWMCICKSLLQIDRKPSVLRRILLGSYSKRGVSPRCPFATFLVLGGAFFATYSIRLRLDTGPSDCKVMRFLAGQPTKRDVNKPCWRHMCYLIKSVCACFGVRKVCLCLCCASSDQKLIRQRATCTGLSNNKLKLDSKPARRMATTQNRSVELFKLRPVTI